jgi:hypothetical protein
VPLQHLLEFMTAHPNVVGNSSKDIYYFSSIINYKKKGLEWYREQMPYSNDKQITLEKSPTYFTHTSSPERVRAVLKSILFFDFDHYLSKKNSKCVSDLD